MKTRLTFLTILLVCAAVLLGYVLVANTSQGDNMAELTLTMSLDKPVYKIGEPIRALIILKNSGNEDVVVNKRMSVNFSDAPRTLRDILFTIVGPSGKNVPFSARINVRPTTKDDFILLSPGEKIEMTYDLKRLYSLNNTGIYSIFSIYQNSIDAENNVTVWKGEIKSNTLSFEVAP